MLKMICPPFLKKGDKIGIVASARKITLDELEGPLQIIHDHGYKAIYSQSLFESYNQFAGDDKLRAKELQQMIDDNSIAAIFFARGGYGSVRIIDKIDFTNLMDNPKWFVGYSDITVFLDHIYHKYGIQSLHATMPINYLKNSTNSLNSLFQTLQGNVLDESFNPHLLNRPGVALGPIIGGNLSVLYSLLGSDSFPDTEGTILFLEDLDEYLYHIDRMMLALLRAGKLENLAGLLVGGMTEMNDNTIPFGKTAEEIIREAVDNYNYPVYFNFPAGHIDDNRALIIGKTAQISMDKEGKPRLSYF